MKFFTSRKILVPLIVFVVLMAITLDAWYQVQQTTNSTLASEFQNQAIQITSLMQNRLDLYTNVLYGAEGLYAASNQVAPNEWTYYVNSLDLADNYKGISAMTYVEKVPASATSSYPFKIYPAAVRDVYYPITYIVTTSAISTSTIAGFDTYSDPVRWAAISKSLATGRPTASGVVLTISSHVPSFSVYAPVYSEGVVPVTAADRAKDVTGFVSVGFRLDNLFNGLSSDAAFDKDINVEVYDAPSLSTASSSNLLFDTDSSHQALTTTKATSMGPLTLQTHMNVGGRTWTIYLSALPAYSSRSLQAYAPMLTFLVGLIASVFISLLIYAYSSSRERAVAIADRITSDLKKSQELLKVSMENAADMILIMKASGAFIDANQMACTTLGYTKDELLKISPAAIFVETPNSKLEDLFGELMEKKNMIVVGKYRKKDGTEFPVEARSSVFGDDPNNLFIISIVRDITTRKEAEQKLLERTQELERTNKLMVDRELAMVDLKKKLADAQKDEGINVSDSSDVSTP